MSLKNQKLDPQQVAQLQMQREEEEEAGQEDVAAKAQKGFEIEDIICVPLKKLQRSKHKGAPNIFVHTQQVVRMLSGKSGRRAPPPP